MNSRFLKMAVALMASAVVLTASLGLAKDKGLQPFSVRGVIQSVDTARNSIALEYSVASNAVVKSGLLNKSLKDLQPGMQVRLQGAVGTHGTQTVNEITMLSTSSATPEKSPAGKKSGKALTFEARGVIQSVDTARKKITLAYSLAPSVVVESGKLSQSLKDLKPGMQVRLQGDIDAHGTWTVHKIRILTGKKTPRPQTMRPNVGSKRPH